MPPMELPTRTLRPPSSSRMNRPSSAALARTPGRGRLRGQPEAGKINGDDAADLGERRRHLDPVEVRPTESVDEDEGCLDVPRSRRRTPKSTQWTGPSRSLIRLRPPHRSARATGADSAERSYGQCNPSSRVTDEVRYDPRTTAPPEVSTSMVAGRSSRLTTTRPRRARERGAHGHRGDHTAAEVHSRRRELQAADLEHCAATRLDLQVRGLSGQVESGSAGQVQRQGLRLEAGAGRAGAPWSSIAVSSDVVTLTEMPCSVVALRRGDLEAIAVDGGGRQRQEVGLRSDDDAGRRPGDDVDPDAPADLEPGMAGTSRVSEVGSPEPTTMLQVALRSKLPRTRPFRPSAELECPALARRATSAWRVAGPRP